MRKTIFITFLAAGLLACLFAGCQLAEPDAAEAPEQDRLIGVYVTREHLDLFDMESYLSDNVGRLTDGGEIEVSPRDSAAYAGRIWAERTDSGDWVFDGLDGMGYYAYRYENEAEEAVASHLDEGITGGGMHYFVDDAAGDRVELSGTVYVTPGAGMKFYCNPVYQTADGAVYLTSGNGVETNGEREGESTAMSLENSVTVTEDGESRTESCKVEMRFEIVWEPVGVTVLQMDEDSAVLGRRSYAPDAVPESLTPGPGCAYVVVETRKSGPEGDLTARELVDAGAECFSTFRARTDGICVKQDTALVWTEEAGV